LTRCSGNGPIATLKGAFVTQPRHRAARSRHRLRPRPLALAAVPVLAAATLVAALSQSDTESPNAQATPSADALDDRGSNDTGVSRSLIGGRGSVLEGLADQGRTIEKTSADTSSPTAGVAAVVTGKRYLTTDLNVWTGPGERYHLATVLSTGERVEVTGVVEGAWAQIVYEHKTRWVRAAYLSKAEPEHESDEATATSGGVTEKPCPLGTSVEAGLTPDAIRVYRSVCAQFPEVTSYGGVRADGGEHSVGRALDIMVSSSSTGDAIAEWVRANASALGASEVLWAQHIWTVERSSEGWRLFEDRGSATANHYDHVHVTVYGDSGG